MRIVSIARLEYFCCLPGFPDFGDFHDFIADGDIQRLRSLCFGEIAGETRELLPPTQLEKQPEPG